MNCFTLIFFFFKRLEMKMEKQRHPLWRWKFNSCSKFHKMMLEVRPSCSEWRKGGISSACTFPLSSADKVGSCIIGVEGFGLYSYHPNVYGYSLQPYIMPMKFLDLLSHSLLTNTLLLHREREVKVKPLMP